MKSLSELKTRREFLRTGLLGGSLSWTLPAFLSRTMDSLHAPLDYPSAAILDPVTWFVTIMKDELALSLEGCPPRA